MWSRVVEVMFGIWLVLSPWIFAHPETKPQWWATDLATGTAVFLLGLFSFWKPTRFAHLVHLMAGCWLVGFAYWEGFGHSPPAAQNDLILGLLLWMFAVIPNHASRPPRSWDKRREAF